MSVKLDLSKMKYMKSDDKSTTLQHPAGHTVTIYHNVLSPDNQKALKGMASNPNKEPVKEDYGKIIRKAKGGPVKGRLEAQQSPIDTVTDNFDEGGRVPMPAKTPDPQPPQGQEHDIPANVSTPSSVGEALDRLKNAWAKGGPVANSQPTMYMHSKGGKVNNPSLRQSNMHIQSSTMNMPIPSMALENIVSPGDEPGNQGGGMAHGGEVKSDLSPDNTYNQYVKSDGIVGGTVFDGSSDEKFLFGNYCFDIDKAREISGKRANSAVPVDKRWIDKTKIDPEEAMKSTSDNPVFIAQLHTPNGIKPLLIDGNHRMYKAIEHGSITIPAYVFSPEQTAQLFVSKPENVEHPALKKPETEIFKGSIRPKFAKGGMIKPKVQGPNNPSLDQSKKSIAHMNQQRAMTASTAPLEQMRFAWAKGGPVKYNKPELAEEGLKQIKSRMPSPEEEAKSKEFWNKAEETMKLPENRKKFDGGGNIDDDFKNEPPRSRFVDGSGDVQQDSIGKVIGEAVRHAFGGNPNFGHGDPSQQQPDQTWNPNNSVPQQSQMQPQTQDQAQPDTQAGAQLTPQMNPQGNAQAPMLPDQDTTQPPSNWTPPMQAPNQDEQDIQDVGQESDQNDQMAQDIANQHQSLALPQPGQSKEQHAQNIFNTMNNEAANVAQDYASGHITPMTYKSMFANAGTLGTISGIFGLILGGAGAGLTHGPNMALEMMNKAMDRDLRAQEASKAGQVNFLNSAQNYLKTQSDIALQGKQGGLLTAQTQAANVNNQILALNLAKTQMMLGVLHHLYGITDGLPSSPQKAAANQTANAIAGTVHQKIVQDNAKAAGEVSNNAANLPGSEQEYASTDAQLRGLGLLGMPEGPQMADIRENHYIPGVGTTDRAAGPGDRDRVLKINNFQNLLEEAKEMQNTQKLGPLTPAQKVRATQLRNDLVSSYNDVKGLNRFTSNEEKLYNDVVPDLASNVGALTGSQQASLDRLTNSVKQKKDLEYQQLGVHPFSGQQKQFPQENVQQSKSKKPMFQAPNGKWYYK